MAVPARSRSKLWLLLWCGLTACATTAPLDKIEFDLTPFGDDGLYGPPDGLRSLSYEFCIPARPTCRAEVESIDPTLQIHSASPGRVDCGPDRYLCIGHTHQLHFRNVLHRLARLEYIERIAPHWAE